MKHAQAVWAGVGKVAAGVGDSEGTEMGRQTLLLILTTSQ